MRWTCGVRSVEMEMSRGVCAENCDEINTVPTISIGSRVRSISRIMGSRRRVTSMYDSPEKGSDERNEHAEF